MLKSRLKEQISRAYPDVNFDVLTPEPKMGDYSVNLAFGLAKARGGNPKELAGQLAGELFEKNILDGSVFKAEAVNGFINLFLKENYLKENLRAVLDKKENYGTLEVKNKKVNIEFVSANPTGPITVGNARAGSFGDALGNVFKKTGFDVTKEYYINDVGVQVKKLGESFHKKFLKNFKHKEVEFGEDLYQGEYVDEYVKKIADELGEAVAEGLNDDGWRNEAVETMIASAKESLKNLGIHFNVWFYESDLHKANEVNMALEMLKDGGKVFEKDGAMWLKYGEDKEAVLVKQDGTPTYLMNDIAYTKNKFERGFDLAINIWGADHHGDVPRLKAGVEALGADSNKLEILLHQLVFIKSGGERQRMSKRKGEFVLLDELLTDVGKDAIRFFFLMKDLNTHMEFDVDLAKEQSKANPVFYIQYANARLNSVFEKAGSMNYEPGIMEAEFKSQEEVELLRYLAKFTDMLDEVSEKYNVHRLAQYALGLASAFHKFYETNRIIDEGKVNSSRLSLAKGVYFILGECLRLMGLSAPEKM